MQELCHTERGAPGIHRQRMDMAKRRAIGWGIPAEGNPGPRWNPRSLPAN